MPHTATRVPTYGNATFDHGVAMGISWHQLGDIELRNPTAELLTDFVKNNILDFYQDGLLTDEQLANFTGFLIGWVIGQYV